MGTLGTLHWLVLFVLIPVLLVLVKKGLSKKTKWTGVLLSLFFSWIGYLAFYLVTSRQAKNVS